MRAEHGGPLLPVTQESREPAAGVRPPAPPLPASSLCLRSFRTSGPSSASVVSFFLSFSNLPDPGHFIFPTGVIYGRRTYRDPTPRVGENVALGLTGSPVVSDFFETLVLVEITCTTSSSSKPLIVDGSEVNVFSVTIIIGILPGPDPCLLVLVPMWVQLHSPTFLLTCSFARPFSIYLILADNPRPLLLTRVGGQRGPSRLAALCYVSSCDVCVYSPR